MNIRNWKREILTIPNLLSLSRLGLIPVYIILYLRANTQKDYFLSGAVLAISCFTDALDGYIARRFHRITLLGKVLDPLADKATQLALIFSLCLRYPVLKLVLTLMVIKESYQATACIVNFRRGKMLPGALPAGKICTAVLFVSLITLVVFPGLENWTVSAVAILDCIFLTVSFFWYVLAYHDMRPGNKNPGS